jgi:glutathione S-transferase
LSLTIAALTKATKSMTTLAIAIGNKNYSSWSLRGWLALKATGRPFDEVVIPLGQPGSRERILAHSPSGRVPALRHDGAIVWDSLAIAEHLAAAFPEARLWPEDGAARAHARSVSAEMHSGFAALRTHMPMNVRARLPGVGRTIGSLEDIERIQASWTDCRVRYASGGPFLFGPFTVADAMYAPVVLRFRTYDVRLEGALRAYSDAILAHPAVDEWTRAAEKEPWALSGEDYPAFRA